MSTVGEVAQKVREFATKGDRAGFQAYVNEELFALYEVDPKGGLACDVLGILWVLAGGPRRTADEIVYIVNGKEPGRGR